MHRQQVTLALKAPRPYEWIGLIETLRQAETVADRQNIDDVTWAILEPDQEWWYSHMTMNRLRSTWKRHDEIALIGVGWAEKE